MKPGRFVVGEILGSASGGLVDVRVDEEELSLHVLRDYTPTTGDEVLVLMRGGSGYVVGALGTSPPAAGTPPGPPPPPDPLRGSTVLRPLETGSYRGGWLAIRDLHQGNAGAGELEGAAFYGPGPGGLVGVVVTGLSVNVTRLRGGDLGAAVPTFGLIEELELAGAPTFLDTFDGPALMVGETRAVTLPDSWGQDLVDGVAGGVGITAGGSSPVVVLSGVTMQLRIDWER